MEKVVLVVIFASVDLAKCHGVAISGNPVCGLNVVGEWHSHKAIDNFIEETEPVAKCIHHTKHDEERHRPKTEKLLYQNQSHRVYHNFRRNKSICNRNI